MDYFCQQRRRLEYLGVVYHFFDIRLNFLRSPRDVSDRRWGGPGSIGGPVNGPAAAASATTTVLGGE